MKRFFGLLFFLILLYFLGVGLGSGLKLGDKNDITNKAGNVFLKRTASAENPITAESKLEYGKNNGIEATSANTVTAIVVNYRAFDTLGEVSVLFLAATGVLALFSLGNKKEKRVVYEEANFILRVSAKFLLPLMITFGFYIFIHGHLTPGGGFQGGTVVAVSVLMLLFAYNNYVVPSKTFKVLEGLAGIGYVTIGLIGLYGSGHFLQNFMHLGNVGSLFSAGIVPVIYVLVGLKVSSEMSGIISDYMGE